MRTIILFYSFTGNNRRLSETLATRIGCPLVEVVEPRRRTLLRIFSDLAFHRVPRIEPLRLPAHDRLLVVAPLWNRWIAHPMRAALKTLGQGIGPYAFVSLSGGDRPGQVAFVDDQLVKLTGRAAEEHWALYVERLVPEHIRGTPEVSQYRVTADDFASFEDLTEITAWARGLEKTAA